MPKPSEREQVEQTDKPLEDPVHLPDVVVEEENVESVDLPRAGTPLEVNDVQKASIRLPDLFIDN